MSQNNIIKILVPLLAALSHESVYDSFYLLAPQHNISKQFGLNYDYQDHDLLISDWQHFDQLRQPKSLLVTYFARPAALNKLKNAILSALNQLVALDTTNNWQARLLTKDTKPFIMQSIFLTNNTYPQLIVPGLTVTGMQFNAQFDTPMPDYFKQVRNYYYIWQKDNYGPYYQKELLNLDPNVDFNKLKTAITSFYEQGLATLHYQVKKYQDSDYDNYNVEPIMYLSLAKLIQNQTQITHNLQQIKTDKSFAPIINYLIKQLNANSNTNLNY